MLATRPCVLSHPLPPGQLSCALETGGQRWKAVGKRGENSRPGFVCS